MAGYINPVGRMPVNYAAGGTPTGNSMGIDYNQLAQDDMIRNANRKASGVGAAAPAPAAPPEVQAQAAWDEAMKLLMREGPYTKEIAQQLTNRQADQTAFAEGINAEELRNSAAARGLAPNDPGIQAALRQAQAQRQQSNVAFQGDIASQAAIQNFAATQPGYMAAAQANLNRQFGSNRTPAVQGGGGARVSPAPRPQVAPANTAFSGTSRGGQGPVATGGSAPTQKKPLSVAERNALQDAWAKSGGKTINGTAGKPATPIPVAAAVEKPITYGSTAFGPVSTAQNARSYQNIYKYTN